MYNIFEKAEVVLDILKEYLTTKETELDYYKDSLKRIRNNGKYDPRTLSKVGERTTILEGMKPNCNSIKDLYKIISTLYLNCVSAYRAKDNTYYSYINFLETALNSGLCTNILSTIAYELSQNNRFPNQLKPKNRSYTTEEIFSVGGLTKKEAIKWDIMHRSLDYLKEENKQR